LLVLVVLSVALMVVDARFALLKPVRSQMSLVLMQTYWITDLPQRLYQGVASQRAYGYWVWADLATLTVSAGPAAAVVLRRAGRAIVTLRPGAGVVPPRAEVAAWLLPLAATAAICAADLSGYSKAEVERIWLPFAVWLLAGAALIPPADRRTWLAAQAAVALTVNHLLLTMW